VKSHTPIVLFKNFKLGGMVAGCRKRRRNCEKNMKEDGQFVGIFPSGEK